MKQLRVVSVSDAMTKKIGEEVAAQLYEEGVRRATILLQGDLGSGKTTFTKGFLNHFGVRPSAASPTFVILKRYVPKKNKAVNSIVHMDAYRLSSRHDLDAFDFKKIENEESVYMLIEWPEKIKGRRFKNKVRISFTVGEKEKERSITIEK